MGDLIHIMNNLVDRDGKIVVPGIYDDVAHLTTAEARLYEVIGSYPVSNLSFTLPCYVVPVSVRDVVVVFLLPTDFDPEEYRADIGTNKLIQNSKEKVLQHRWRYPSLSLHGILPLHLGLDYPPSPNTFSSCSSY
mgnify:CR=1 FL=1